MPVLRVADNSRVRQVSGTMASGKTDFFALSDSSLLSAPPHRCASDHMPARILKGGVFSQAESYGGQHIRQRRRKETRLPQGSKNEYLVRAFNLKEHLARPSRHYPTPPPLLPPSRPHFIPLVLFTHILHPAPNDSHILPSPCQRTILHFVSHAMFNKSHICLSPSSPLSRRYPPRLHCPLLLVRVLVNLWCMKNK